MQQRQTPFLFALTLLSGLALSSHSVSASTFNCVTGTLTELGLLQEVGTLVINTANESAAAHVQLDPNFYAACQKYVDNGNRYLICGYVEASRGEIDRIQLRPDGTTTRNLAMITDASPLLVIVDNTNDKHYAIKCVQ